MATGTQNPPAGEYALHAVVHHRHGTADWKYPVPWSTEIRDAWSLEPRDTSYDPTAIVSVAPQCVGARRCPLLLALPGGGLTAQVTTDWLRPATGKYGIILLALTENHYSPAEVDAALQETLARFAIDPAKIAILGRCASGGWGGRYGTDNPEIFSRIAMISGEMVDTTWAGKVDKAKVEFLIDDGLGEKDDFRLQESPIRRAGFTVRRTVTIRGHEHQEEDYDLLGRWLIESWAKPPAARPQPVSLELPVLTSDAFTRLTTFWTRFFQEPDSIRNAGRRATIRDVLVTVGRPQPGWDRAQQVIVPMSDMAALAAKYPSVAADLKRAGLTGRQHDSYRVALVTARLTPPQDFDSTTVQGQNIAFVRAHADELQRLEDVGIVNRDGVAETGVIATFRPSQIERLGPLGIWRTP